MYVMYMFHKYCCYSCNLQSLTK